MNIKSVFNDKIILEKYKRMGPNRGFGPAPWKREASD